MTQVGEVPYAMHPDFAQALKGFAYAGVAYEGPPPAALTPEIAALLGVSVAAEPSADMKPRAAKAAARISAQKLNVPVALQGALEEAIDAIADAKTPEELSAALAAAETLIDQANAKADGQDKLEGPQEKMERLAREIEAIDEDQKKRINEWERMGLLTHEEAEKARSAIDAAGDDLNNKDKQAAASQAVQDAADKVDARDTTGTAKQSTDDARNDDKKRENTWNDMKEQRAALKYSTSPKSYHFEDVSLADSAQLNAPQQRNSAQPNLDQGLSI